jgi:hypothetical protein
MVVAEVGVAPRQATEVVASIATRPIFVRFFMVSPTESQ